MKKHLSFLASAVFLSSIPAAALAQGADPHHPEAAAGAPVQPFAPTPDIPSQGAAPPALPGGAAPFQAQEMAPAMMQGCMGMMNMMQMMQMNMMTMMNMMQTMQTMQQMMQSMPPPVPQLQTRLVPGASGSVYTADELGHSVSGIDLASGVVETVPVSISPHNVQVTADGTALLVVGEAVMAAPNGGANAALGAMDGEGLLVIPDPLDLSSGPLASIEVGEHPAHVVVDQTGRYAFVSLSGEDAVAVVDLKTHAVARTIETGGYPHGLRISPDGDTIYVANVEGGNVSVLDTSTYAELERIPVGDAPVQVGFTPDGSQAYVSLRDQDRVAVIDTATREVTKEIEVGPNPIQVHVTPDGLFVYVANQGTEIQPNDTVSVIDVASGAVIDTIHTGAGAHGVSVSADGRYVFVTNIVDGTVSMIDAGTRAVVASIPVGAGPNGITFREGVVPSDAMRRD